MPRVSSATSKSIRDTVGDHILGPCRLVQATGKLLAKMIEAKAAGKWSLSRLLRPFQSTPRAMVAYNARQHGTRGHSYFQPNLSGLLFNLFYSISHFHVGVMPCRTAIFTLAHLKPATQYIFLCPARFPLPPRILTASVTLMRLSQYVCKVLFL